MLRNKTNKFRLNREDFATYKEYKREYDRLNRQTDAYKDIKRKSDAKYSKSDKGKKSRKKAVQKYGKTAKGKLTKERYRKDNPEKRKLAVSKYQKSDKGKSSREKFRLKNKGYYNSLTAKQRAIKLQRLPIWADLKAIEEIYINCPPGYVVDHIVALNGKNVSGLHVANNLQYLTPRWNRLKGNKYIV